MNLTPYFSMLTGRFRTLLQYRTAALAGVGTQIFWGVVRVMIFAAFYRSSSAPQPMTREEVITYIWLGQAALLLVMFNAEPEIAGMIRSGAVAYELTRPLDLYWLWFARCFSARAAPLLMRAVPILLLSGIFMGLQPPASVALGLLFIISIFLALLLAYAIVLIITMSLLWTISGEGISRLAPAMIFFFSGIVIPLPLFPQWMQPFIAAMPFRGLIDTPFRIYLGHMKSIEAASALAQQVGWIIAFIVIGRLILSRGVRRLVVQGG